MPATKTDWCLDCGHEWPPTTPGEFHDCPQFSMTPDQVELLRQANMRSLDRQRAARNTRKTK